MHVSSCLELLGGCFLISQRPPFDVGPNICAAHLPANTIHPPLHRHSDRYDDGYEDGNVEPAPSRRFNSTTASRAVGGGVSRIGKRLGDDSRGRDRSRSPGRGGCGDSKQDSDTGVKRSRLDWVLPKGRGGGEAASTAAPTAAGGGSGEAATRVAPSRPSFVARMFNQMLGQALQEQQRRSGAAATSREESGVGREPLGRGGVTDRWRDRDEGREHGVCGRDRGGVRENDDDDDRRRRRYRD